MWSLMYRFCGLLLYHPPSMPCQYHVFHNCARVLMGTRASGVLILYRLNTPLEEYFDSSQRPEVPEHNLPIW
ncbi:hypothetical protein BDR03DRAFT_33798 [Suillus americanus]|nr:hypothetical protein BDR03DRAFT_33798 [Suillus americanus]